MGITERKARQRAELRDAILGAARRILTSEGADALTMRRIADAIEYSPGTLYLHFASREEIALQLVRDGFAQLVAAFGPGLRIADPIERLRALGRAYIRFARTQPATYKLIFMENARYAAAVLSSVAPTGGEHDPGRRAFAILAATLREAVDAGIFKPVDPERTAEAFWAALHGIVSLHITCPQTIADVEGVAALTEATFIAGLRA